MKSYCVRYVDNAGLNNETYEEANTPDEAEKEFLKQYKNVRIVSIIKESNECRSIIRRIISEKQKRENLYKTALVCINYIANEAGYDEVCIQRCNEAEEAIKNSYGSGEYIDLFNIKLNPKNNYENI